MAKHQGFSTRCRAVGMITSGMTYGQVAEALGVTRRTIYRWLSCKGDGQAPKNKTLQELTGTAMDAEAEEIVVKGGDADAELEDKDYEEEEEEEEGLPASAASTEEETHVIHVITSNSQSGVSPRGKQKQYAQRYRREWETLDFCRGWLNPHPNNILLAYCKVCDRSLHARKNDLRKHAACSKHKKNMVFYERGTPVRRSGGGGPSKTRRFHPSLLDNPELTGWCTEYPGKENRVWCRQCRCGLTAQLKALRTHKESRKHLSNADQEPCSPPPHTAEFHLMDTTVDDVACYGSPAGGGDDDRVASPLLESDFSGRVTYSIGLGNRKVGFLGAGQISQAIAQGMLEQGLLLPHDVIVGAPSDRNMTQWKRWKCKTTNSNDEVVSEADIVFVAVKASVLFRLVGRLTPISDGKTRLFISVVPGVSRERMVHLLACRVLPAEPTEGESEAVMTGPPLHVIRCAPNKMVAISAGFCAYSMGEDVPHSLYLVVETMFSALGTCVQVQESLMDAYSTMIASGAAFTCAFIEAMVQGGVSLDLGWDEALKVASAVVSGTSKLLMRTSQDPSTLRKSISTPGGSTIAGLAALRRGGLDDAVGKALQLACEKTVEAGDAVYGQTTATTKP